MHFITTEVSSLQMYSCKFVWFFEKAAEQRKTEVRDGLVIPYTQAIRNVIAMLQQTLVYIISS